MSVLLEALVVGVTILIVWHVVNYVAEFALDDEQRSSAWYLPLSLFLTGFAGHLLFEISGANRWYCKSGAACNR